MICYNWETSILGTLPANVDILWTPFIRKSVFDLRVIEYQCRDACQMGVTEHIFKHFEYI